MTTPATDPRLSKRAAGFFYFYLEIGRVISAEEALDRPDVSEGRDAIRSAMKELELAGYIKMEQHRVKGQFRSYWKFADESLNMPYVKKTSDGFSVSGFSGNLHISSGTVANTNTSDKSLSLNRDKVLRTLSLGPDGREGKEMAWPFEEEESKPLKKKVAEEIEATPGAVGKVEDRQARLNAKYKKTRFEAVPRSMQRFDKPEEDWEVVDIVGEFYDSVREHARGVPSQVNGDALRSWMNRMISEGATKLGMLKAVRMFFADPRLIREPGVGEPLWRRFVAYYPTVHGIVHRDQQPEGDAEAMKQHQEKMLKLLEG